MQGRFLTDKTILYTPDMSAYFKSKLQIYKIEAHKKMIFLFLFLSMNLLFASFKTY